MNIWLGESLDARDDDPLPESAIVVPLFDELVETFDFVATVCVLPLNIDISSLESLDLEGLKISLGMLGGTPLLASRKA